MSLLSNISTSPTARKLSEANILWVDDRPDNNVYERRALETLGIRFTLSLSTDDALDKLRHHPVFYQAIISDMGRPPDPQAGYTLLNCLQDEGFHIPFIIYAGSNSSEHKQMAKEKGAFGSTNNPQELFQMVIDAVEQGVK